MTTLHGQGVSRGVAIGPIHRLGSGPAELRPRSGAVPEEELARFEAARAQARAWSWREIYQQTLETLGEENALLFQIHQMVLEDPDFCEGVEERIRDGADRGLCRAGGLPGRGRRLRRHGQRLYAGPDRRRAGHRRAAHPHPERDGGGGPGPH